MLNFKTLVLIQAPVETLSGYGQHSRDIVKSLFKLYPDWEYSIISTRWGDTPQNVFDEEINKRINRTGQLERKPDIFIQISVPNEFTPYGDFNIGITAGIETTVASAEFVSGCNRMDLIIFPSKFAEKVIINSQWQNNEKNEIIKFNKNSAVLFEGVDLDIYQEIKWID